MNNIKKDTILLSFANFIQVFIALILSIGLARIFIDKGEFGKYQQIFVCINFIFSLGNGINISLNYFYGKYLKYSNRIVLIKKIFGTIILFAILGTIVFAIINRYLANNFQNNYIVDYSIPIVIILFFRILNSFFINFNLITKRLFYHTKIQIIHLFLILILLFFAYKYSFTTKEVLLFLGAIEFIKFLFFSRYLYFYLTVPSRKYIANVIEFKYILPITAVGLINVLNVYVDKIMVSSILTPVNYADYQVGAFVIPFMGIITSSVITVLIPHFAKLHALNKIKELITIFREAIKKMSTLLVPILIYCIVFGQELITFLYSDNYELSGRIFQIYTINYLLSVVTFAAILGATGLQNWIVINSLFNLITNLILNYFFIKQFGTIGAVYATLLSTYLGYIFPIYLMWKNLNSNFFSYFPIFHYLKIVIASIIFSLLFYSIYYSFDFAKVYSIVFSFAYYLIVLFIVNRLFGLNLLGKKFNIINVKQIKSLWNRNL